MENMESTDLQMCGGCGKRFERKAALHSHSQMCVKRIAVCNTIKEKKALEEAQNQKISKNALSHQPKGSEKRKPIRVRKKLTKNEIETEALNEVNGQTPEEEKSLVSTLDKPNGIQNQDMINTVTVTNCLSDIVKNEVESRSCTPETDYFHVEENKEKTEILNEIKTEADCNSCDSHTLHDETPVDSVTEDPSMDFEPQYDILSMGNEHLSMFRSSISHADICNIIGVSVVKMESLPPDDVKQEQDIRIEEQLCMTDVNTDKNTTKLFQDENSWNSDGDTHQQKKEVPRRMRIDPKRTFCETTLECKAEGYMDKQKCLCLPCDTEFSSESDLMEHMSQHFNWYSYQCGKCTYMSYHKTPCMQHVCTQHTVDQSELENTVLSVPNWKALKFSTEFIPLKDDLKTRKIIMEVICGSNVDEFDFSDVAKQPVIKPEPRPIRNRTKSIRVIQDDFLYDLDRNSKRSCKNNENGNVARKPTKKVKEIDLTRKKTAAIKPIQKTETSCDSNCTSKLVVKKPLKVYAKQGNVAIKRNSPIINSIECSEYTMNNE